MKKEMRIYSEEQLHFLRDGIQIKLGLDDTRERHLCVTELENGGKEFMVMDDGGVSVLGEDSISKYWDVYAVADVI